MHRGDRQRSICDSKYVNMFDFLEWTPKSIGLLKLEKLVGQMSLYADDKTLKELTYTKG